jgi:hypothetical protein
MTMMLMPPMRSMYLPTESEKIDVRSCWLKPPEASVAPMTGPARYPMPPRRASPTSVIDVKFVNWV